MHQLMEHRVGFNTRFYCPTSLDFSYFNFIIKIGVRLKCVLNLNWSLCDLMLSRLTEDASKWLFVRVLLTFQPNLWPFLSAVPELLDGPLPFSPSLLHPTCSNTAGVLLEYRWTICSFSLCLRPFIASCCLRQMATSPCSCALLAFEVQTRVHGFWTFLLLSIKSGGIKWSNMSCSSSQE